MRTYGALREKIKKVYGTIDSFSDAMRKNRSTISQKLNSLVSWTQDEIEKACGLLGIPTDEIPKYFFYDE